MEFGCNDLSQFMGDTGNFAFLQDDKDEMVRLGCFTCNKKNLHTNNLVTRVLRTLQG